MGLIITPEQEIIAYYESDAMSQSKLKKLLTGIDAFIAEQEDISKKPYIIQGKAVDTILTGEEGDFEKNFYISSSEKKPTDAVASIVNYVYDRVSEDYTEYLSTITPLGGTQEIVEGQEIILIEHDNLEDEVPITPFLEFIGRLDQYEAYIIEGCEQYVGPTGSIGYQSRWGVDARLKAICEPGSAYFIDLCSSYGKTIIDSTMNNTIQSIVESLRTNLRTASYFDRYEQKDFTHVDVILQMPIYFEYRDIQCKALLDLVTIVRDSDGKILLISPFDLKTMNGNTYNFLNSIKSYRYDIQGVWYTLALRDFYCVSDKQIAPFRFIVESTTKQGKPLVYELDESIMKIARWGRPAYISEYGHLLSAEINGVEQLLDMYEYHERNGWEAEEEIQQADSIDSPLIVNWNGFVNRNPFENPIIIEVESSSEELDFEFKKELLSQEEIEITKSDIKEE